MTRLAVVGAGTMGHGIAQMGATAGCDVALTDADPSALQSALGKIQANLDGGVDRGKLTRADADAALGRINLRDDIESAALDADIVVEAILEDLDVKRDLFTRLDGVAPPDAVLATNTSSLSVGDIAQATSRPQLVLGMHFFNPVHIMKLVEIVVHGSSDVAAVERVRDLAEGMGKDPIVVRDSPGFASSRLGVALGLEAIKAMELGYGHPMGPLRVSDLVGLDVRLAIAEYLQRELDDVRFAPPEILRRKVQAGELGKKTGRGFHEWPKRRSS
jgi:3-hydroxybutyryl-CoA dehydrogenase